MNIDYLYYFMDVAKTKSITRAAKLNFISPQGMSRAMNELEKELGCQLLARFSNKLELSEAGEKIEPYISRTIESYSRLLDFATSESHLEQNESRSIMLECQNVAMLAFLTREAKDYVIASDAIHFRECQNTQIRYDLLMSAEASDPAPTIGLVCFFRQNHGSSLDGINDLEKAGFQYRPFLRTYDKVLVNVKCDVAKKEKLTDADIVEKRIACTNTELSTLLANRFGRDAIVLSSADWSLRRRYGGKRFGGDVSAGHRDAHHGGKRGFRAARHGQPLRRGNRFRGRGVEPGRRCVQDTHGHSAPLLSEAREHGAFHPVRLGSSAAWQCLRTHDLPL